MRIVLLAFAVLLVSVAAEAQTVTATMSWFQPNLTLAEVQALTYSVQVDGLPVIPVTQTCVAGAPVKCTSPISFETGPHVITLTVRNVFGSASATFKGGPPEPPITFTITCNPACSVTVP